MGKIAGLILMIAMGRMPARGSTRVLARVHSHARVA
jgi:hypothetical protein